MNEKLKPCPFCGAEIKDYSVTSECGIIKELSIKCCVKVDIASDPMLTSLDGEKIFIGSDALQKWNRRAEDET